MADETTTNPSEAQVQQGNTAATATIDTEAAREAQAEADRQAQEEAELIGGKFKSQDDLLNAYKELEKKLGQGGGSSDEEEGQQSEETAEETTEGGEGDETNDTDGEGDENPYGPVVGEALEKADLKVEDLQKEWDENGTLSDDSFKAFEDAGFPRPMVEAYLRGVSQGQTETQQITEQQIETIKSSVGGEESFAEVQKHIQTSFTPEQVEQYNEAIGSGDFSKAQAAVQQAYQSYLRTVGTEGKMLGGKAPAQQAGYASEAEMLDDMKRPEYKQSQAFRDKVAQKIAASPNLMITR